VSVIALGTQTRVAYTVHPARKDYGRGATPSFLSGINQP